MRHPAPHIRKRIVELRKQCAVRPVKAVVPKTTRRGGATAFFYIRKCIVQPTKGRVPEVALHRIGVVTARKSGDENICFTASLCSPLDKFDAEIALQKASKHTLTLTCEGAFKISFVELMDVLGMTHPQAIAQLSAVPTRLHNRALRRIVCDALDIRMSNTSAYLSLVKTRHLNNVVASLVDRAKKFATPVKRKSNKKNAKV